MALPGPNRVAQPGVRNTFPATAWGTMERRGRTAPGLSCVFISISCKDSCDWTGLYSNDPSQGLSAVPACPRALGLGLLHRNGVGWNDSPGHVPCREYRGAVATVGHAWFPVVGAEPPDVVFTKSPTCPTCLVGSSTALGFHWALLTGGREEGPAEHT